jgi:hypothetical protein
MKKGERTMTTETAGHGRGFERAEPKEIKRQLVAKFNHPFSVSRDRGTASHWINVRWEDGPTDSEVRDFLFKFNDSGRDDIMTDLWCGSQYTNTHRSISADLYRKAAEAVGKAWGVPVTLALGNDWKGKPRAYVPPDFDFDLNKGNGTARRISWEINGALEGKADYFLL